MSPNNTSDGFRSVRFPQQSLLRDYMLHQSAVRQKDLSGFTLGGKLGGMFVENEILVNRRDDKTISFLVERFGGELIPADPLPEKPRDFELRRERSIEGMPQMVKVKIKGQDFPMDPLERLISREAPEGMLMSSAAGAGTMAAMQLLKEKDLGGQLNLAGNTTGFPLTSSSENFPGANDAYNWPEYKGKSNISKAWQLCQALDNVRSMRHPIFIGILDVGYGFVPPFDYAIGPQLNLTNEGSSIAGPTGIGSYAWHGSATTGVATAVINNNRGAGGVGGLPVGPANLPVAIPFMFRTNIVISEIYRCLQCCVAWGIDVLNMSFSMTWPKFFLPMHRDWDDSFQFAKDQGLIMVASAANDGSELPDKVVFPATRTPGVITVGALDSSYNNARSDSNYGSSVDIWAPGTDIHTVPDPGNPTCFFQATSAAAPVVSGVAALLLSINSNLTSDDVKFILRDTAHTDSPDWKSNRILNAYQAVLKTINFALPPGTFEEPNNTPSTAKSLIQTSTNVWVPLGETVISQQGDVDFFHFNTVEYADVWITLDYVRPLSIVVMEIFPDEPDSLLFNDFADVRMQGHQRLSFRNAPPGSYRLKIRSQAPNYYKLRVSLLPKPLEPDEFENNQTKESAAVIRLRTRNPMIDAIGLHSFFQGAYEANILNPADIDWYHIKDITHRALTFPCFDLLNSDAPLDLRLYGPGGGLLNTFLQVKQKQIHLPQPECWVEVRSAKATRYAVFFGYMLDKSQLPPPHQREDIEIIPKWWPDPPFEINKWEKWLEIEINEELSQHGRLELQTDAPLQLDLLSPERSLLQSATTQESGLQILNVEGMAPGKYLLRVGRVEGPAARFQSSQQAPVKFRIGPSF